MTLDEFKSLTIGSIIKFTSAEFVYDGPWQGEVILKCNLSQTDTKGWILILHSEGWLLTKASKSLNPFFKDLESLDDSYLGQTVVWVQSSDATILTSKNNNNKKNDARCTICNEYNPYQDGPFQCWSHSH